MAWTTHYECNNTLMDQEEYNQLCSSDHAGVRNDLHCEGLPNSRCFPQSRADWWMTEGAALYHVRLGGVGGVPFTLGIVRHHDGSGCPMQFRADMEELFRRAGLHELHANREPPSDTQRQTWLMGALKGHALVMLKAPLKKLLWQLSVAEPPPSALISVAETQRSRLVQ